MMGYISGSPQFGDIISLLQFEIADLAFFRLARSVSISSNFKKGLSLSVKI